MVDAKSREQYVAEGGTDLAEYNLLGMWPYDCAINVFRAMLNEVGMNRTIEATRHYNDAWGRAVVGMVQERFGPQASDLESIAMTGYYVHNCTSMGHIKPLEIYEGGAICELFACPNPGMKAPPEMCIAMSHIMSNGFCRAINPDYEVIFTHHMGNGDDCCRWVAKKKGGRFTLDNLGLLQKKIPQELPMDELVSFSGRMVIMSQLFTFTTALNDLVGSKRTNELVVPLAAETGLRAGKMIQGGNEEKGGLEAIENAINVLSTPWGLQQGGSPATFSSAGIEKEILECPCKGSPPEVCEQFEAVFNGVCRAINPDFEFAYDRMMSKGARTCHWMVRRRSDEHKASRDRQIEDDLLSF